MNRGDVWQVDVGGRAGRRPALIMTRQAVIPHLNKVTVVEITATGKGHPTEVAIGQRANLPKESYVQLDNIQTVSKDRFVKYVGAARSSHNENDRTQIGTGARTRRLRLISNTETKTGTGPACDGISSIGLQVYQGSQQG